MDSLLNPHSGKNFELHLYGSFIFINFERNNCCELELVILMKGLSC